jgi:hypothetical protein
MITARAFLTLGVAAAATASGAQGFEGLFSVATPEGTLVLELRPDGSGGVTGAVTGLPYPVQVVGRVSGDAIQGRMQAPEGVSVFEGRLSGDSLELAVAELNAFGQPDASTLQRFALTRAAGGAAAATPAAPASGDYTDPDRGWAFGIPEGWQARRGPEEILLASPSHKGLVVVLPHEASSVAELRAEAAQGLAEGGVVLRPSGPIEDFGPAGIAAPFEGTADGTPVRAWGVAVVSPHGVGATVLAIVEKESFGPAHRETVDSVARSLRFSKPQAPPEAAGWKQRLAGYCLAYRSSSFSSGASYGGYSTGTSFSDRSSYFLAEDGRFTSDSASSATFDGGGGFGSSFSNAGPQVGQWRVGGDAGAPTLELSFADGRRVVHRLTTDDRGRTYLDGDRWLRVTFQECRDN